MKVLPYDPHSVDFQTEELNVDGRHCEICNKQLEVPFIWICYNGVGHESEPDYDAHEEDGVIDLRIGVIAICKSCLPQYIVLQHSLHFNFN